MAVTEPLAAVRAGAPRRETLLESGLAVFTRKGVAQSRVEDICAEAGVSRATFYRYFDGKADLFGALIDVMADEVLYSAAHLGAVTPDAEGKATIARWIADLIDITERWGTLVDEVNRPRATTAPARGRAVVLTARFADILAERFAEGGVTGVDTKMAALAIIAMTERMAHQIRTWNVEIDRTTMVEALATLSIKMLHPKVTIRK